MFCLCGYQEAGCCLYPPSREKRGGLKTAAPAPQPANPARRWRQWPPPSPFPTSKLGSGTQAPSPNSAANSVSLTLTPRPPNPYAQELGGEGRPHHTSVPNRFAAPPPGPPLAKCRKHGKRGRNRAVEPKKIFQDLTAPNPVPARPSSRPSSPLLLHNLRQPLQMVVQRVLLLLLVPEGRHALREPPCVLHALRTQSIVPVLFHAGQ